MVVIRPGLVRFGDEDWEGVERITIDRFGVREIEEWGSVGQHVVFADVSRVRVKIRVVQEFEADDLVTPALGAMDTLEFDVSSGSDAGRARVEVDAVVESVSYAVGGSVTQRTISLVGVSVDGVGDPVRVDEL